MDFQKFIRSNRSMFRNFLPKKNKNHRILFGILKNYRIFTNWRNYPSGILGRTEKELIDWFSKNIRNGERWIDVGANYDFTTIALAKFTEENGEVFAIEPVPGTCGNLIKTMELNRLTNVNVFCLALAECAPFSLDYFNTSRGILNDKSEKSNIGIISIPFNKFWASIDGGRIDGMKIDVDGQELVVINGMKNTLEKYHPKLIVELHDSTCTETEIILENLGYKFS